MLRFSLEVALPLLTVLVVLVAFARDVRRRAASSVKLSAISATPALLVALSTMILCAYCVAVVYIAEPPQPILANFDSGARLGSVAGPWAVSGHSDSTVAATLAVSGGPYKEGDDGWLAVYFAAASQASSPAAPLVAQSSSPITLIPLATSVPTVGRYLWTLHPQKAGEFELVLRDDVQPDRPGLLAAFDQSARGVGRIAFDPVGKVVTVSVTVRTAYGLTRGAGLWLALVWSVIVIALGAGPSLYRLWKESRERGRRGRRIIVPGDPGWWDRSA